MLVESRAGIEPAMAVLQTAAFPLGYPDVTSRHGLTADGGAGDGDRTHDNLLGKQGLYH